MSWNQIVLSSTAPTYEKLYSHYYLRDVLVVGNGSNSAHPSDPPISSSFVTTIAAWPTHSPNNTQNAQNAPSTLVIITTRGSSHSIRAHIGRLPKDRPLKLAVVRKWARDLAGAIREFVEKYSSSAASAIGGEQAGSSGGAAGASVVHGGVYIDNVFVRRTTGNLILGSPALGLKKNSVLASLPDKRQDVVGFALCVMDIVGRIVFMWGPVGHGQLQLGSPTQRELPNTTRRLPSCWGALVVLGRWKGCPHDFATVTGLGVSTLSHCHGR